MLPASSVRALVPSWASVAPLAVFAPSLARCHHQRRCSSSKSSRPDNDPSDVSPGHSVATSSTSARGDGKKKRKIKDVLANKLPSVPTTQHMSEEALGLSRFFSLYRPISITQTMPQTVTHEHFASIFAPQYKAKKHADTVSTLSNTIDRLDSPIKQMPTGMQVDDANISDAAAATENSEGAKLISLHIETMGGDFLPFRPPPLPRPQSADEAELVPETPQHRVYKAMFIIEETTEPSGQVRVLAHSPRIYDGPRGSFLGRMAGRQAHFNESNAVRRDMHAISVRRQRKLRMKKKKYKKLMKRTRNARRKLDRT